MLRSVCWRIYSYPFVVNQGESCLGKLVALCKDAWHVSHNLCRLIDLGEEMGYFHSVPGAKSCLNNVKDGLEFRAYVDENQDEEAQLVMAAMIGLVEESPNFATSYYKFTEIEL